MTQKSGASASSVARMRSRLISASTRTAVPGRPRRRARIATWAPLSSPVTYSTFMLRDSASSACSSRVLLPMPGSPPISTTPPATMPPPSTRSSSSSVVGVRAVSTASISDSVATGALLLSAWKRWPLPAAGSAGPSSRVFQAPQPGHLPIQRGLAAPHSVHV